jgi:hypothetical protein
MPQFVIPFPLSKKNSQKEVSQQVKHFLRSKNVALENKGTAHEVMFL